MSSQIGDMPNAVLPPSWYAATANDHLRRPSLRGAARCDVCIVGAGYTGLITAIELARKGFDVIVLEAERVGWGASGRNGGQIVTGFNRSIAEIAESVGRDDARKLWDLSEEAKAIIRELVDGNGIDCDLRWGYLLAAVKPRQLGSLREWVDELQDLGYQQARLLDRDEMRARVESPAYVGGAIDGGSGQLHPLNYALGLARVAEKLGVRIFEGSRVTALRTEPSPEASTPEGRVSARFLVLAGNAYLGGLVPALRRRIMPVSTYILATERLGENRARALIPDGEAVADVNFVLNYYRRSPDHRLLFGGGVSYSGLDRPDLRSQMRRAMVKVFPQLADVAIEYCWGGNVAITLDRLPDLGRISPNVYYAHGYSGHGVALTAIAGRIIAEAIAGQAERFDVFARLPHRPFPGGPALRTPALVLAMTWYRLRDLL